jgi:acetyl esterase/lipase
LLHSTQWSSLRGISPVTIDLSIEPRYEFDVHDHVYSRQGDEDWLARVYQPRGAGPFPTLLNVHGGVWARKERTHGNELSEALAARGVLTIGVDLHVPPAGVFPAPMRDVNVAVRWLKAHAADFNGLPAVGAIGTSSGGHQVELVALQPHDPRYADLPGEPGTDATIAYGIACWPISDPRYRYGIVKSNGPELYIRGSEAFWGDEATMDSGSPQVVLDTGAPGIQTPPILVIHREDDPLHPLEMHERFVKSYREHGGDIELVVLPDLPQVFTMSPEGERMLEVVLGYIAGHAVV